MKVKYNILQAPVIELIYAIQYFKKKNSITIEEIKATNYRLLLGNCLDREQEMMINSIISKIGLYNLYNYVILLDYSDDILKTLEEKELSVLSFIIKDEYFNLKLSMELGKYYFQYKEYLETLDQWIVQSRYKDMPCIKDSKYEEITIKIIPSVFMESMPDGKMGWTTTTNSNELVVIIIFGIEGLLEFGASYFIKWFRRGLSHYMTRILCQEVVTNNYLVNNVFPFSSEVMYFFDDDIPFHRDYIQYIFQNIIVANKLINSFEVIGYNELLEIDELVREPISKGVFHVKWFINKIIEYNSLTKSTILPILEEWHKEVQYLKYSLPIFPGNLNASGFDIWKRNSRIIFSPSISPNSRRMLKLLDTTKKSSPVATDIKSLYDYEWSNYNNIVYGLKQDEDWISILTNEINGVCGFNYNSSIIYIKRKSDQLWDKICLCKNEDDLINMQKIGNSSMNVDWILISNETKITGIINSTSGYDIEFKPITHTIINHLPTTNNV